MNRERYYSLCTELLSNLCTRIEVRGGQNLLDLHVHSENFYMHFFNNLYGYELENINVSRPNMPGIDLKDMKRKIIVQVSATATKQKIESALGHSKLASYEGWHFKFISISKKSHNLREANYQNPHRLMFNPSTDIYDIESILRDISALDMDALSSVCLFLKKELSLAPQDNKSITNIAKVIEILSKIDLEQSYPNNTLPFNIDDKISKNGLDIAQDWVENYKIHHHRVDNIYTEFDKLGVNKSKSVLDTFRMDYNHLRNTFSGDQLFFAILDSAKKRVMDSANYCSIPDEELDLCIAVLAVDAFIRCKIFKNPEEVQNATT